MAELELRRGLEPATNLDFRLLPGTSNSRVKEALNSLGTRFTDPEVLEPVFSLFAPLEPTAQHLTAKLEPRNPTPATPPENLWEQVWLAYQTYPYLEKPDQQNLLALTGRALDKLTLPLERPSHGETKVLTPHVRNRAQEVSQAFQAFQKDELKRLAERQKGKKPTIKVPRLIARLAPVLALVGAGCGPMTTPRTPDIGSAVTPQVSEVAPLPSPTVEVAPTPLPGGPETPVALPWPTALSQIPETVAGAGGAFTLETSAPNVLAQREAVIAKLQEGGWTTVPTPEGLTSGQTAFVSPIQEGDRWAIAAMTQDGFMMPVDQSGRVMDRPDWATSNVASYTEISDGLGSGYNRRFELIDDHWVPVTRNGEGRLVAFYDVVNQEWIYNEAAMERQIVIAGVGDGDRQVQIPEAITAYLPDDPTLHLVDAAGNPIPDGTIIDALIPMTSLHGSFEQPEAFVAARIRGVVHVDAGKGLLSYLLFEIRLAPGQSIYLALDSLDFENPPGSGEHPGAFIDHLPGGDISRFDWLPFLPDGRTANPNMTPVSAMPRTDLIAFMQSHPGLQVLIGIYHDYPPQREPMYVEQNPRITPLLEAIRQRRLPTESVASAYPAFGDGGNFISTLWSIVISDAVLPR